MRTVYVIGAKEPFGGSFMAYHLGRLLHLEYGYNLVDVYFREVSTSLFQYDVPMDSISLAEFEESIEASDLLIAYPSLSHFQFGMRLPGRKLMYAQDFRTFSWIDCYFDMYVCVSTIVQNFLEIGYQIPAPVIPAFIDVASAKVIPDWEERPARSFLLYCKHDKEEHLFLKNEVQKFLHDTIPDAVVTEANSRSCSQEVFFEKIAQHRYFINLSIGEGFGLPALEAMALGCTVLGLDGIAGRDYMRSGENCMTYPYKRWHEMLESIPTVSNDPVLSKKLAQQGQSDAQQYSYKAFVERWMPLLREFAGT